jgi:hypothetical protein
MITDRDIRNQVETTLAGSDLADDFDMDGAVAEIISTYGLVSLDTIDSEDFWALVERYDVSTD